jgi:hypothetical protein
LHKVSRSIPQDAGTEKRPVPTDAHAHPASKDTNRHCAQRACACRPCVRGYHQSMGQEKQNESIDQG